MYAINVNRISHELSWKETQVPELKKDSVLLKVKACGINRADVMQKAGKYPPPPGASEIMGLEASGIIESCGSGVTKYKTGDKVCCLVSGGAFAEYVAVPESQLMPVPEVLSFEQAAAIPEAYITAYLNLFHEGKLQAGQKVFISAAASGVGIAAIHLSRAFKASVLAVAGSDQKRDFLKTLGVDLAYNYKTSLRGILEHENTVDLVLDLVGASNLDLNLRLLRRKGRHVIISAISGAKVEIDLLKVLKKNISIIGSTLRDKPEADKAELMADFSQKVLPLFADGSLKPVIHEILPIQQANQAMKILEENLNIGKVVLSI